MCGRVGAFLPPEAAHDSAEERQAGMPVPPQAGMPVPPKRPSPRRGAWRRSLCPLRAASPDPLPAHPHSLESGPLAAQGTRDSGSRNEENGPAGMFDRYEVNGLFDEMFEAPARPRPHYAAGPPRLSGMGPPASPRRVRMADVTFRNQGITFT